MSRRVIGLIRVSGEAQAGPDRHGLPVQRDSCERLATAMGLEVVDWVVLEGVSGAAVLEDPRFMAVLDQVRIGAVCGVVVDAFDRLFRRGKFGDFLILDAFAESGGLLYTSEGTFNPAEDGGAIMALLKGELGGQERRAIIRRTWRGREKKRRERGVRAEGGFYPRGVGLDHKAEKWFYIFPEAEQVREGYRLFLESEGTMSLAAVGRAIGVGQDKPSHAVRKMLSNPIYMGVYRVNRHWVNGKAVPRDPEDCYEHNVLDPPLVSPEDWGRVQELLTLRKPARPGRLNPDDQDGDYSGYLDCPECGRRVLTQPANRRQRAAYRCYDQKKLSGHSWQMDHRKADRMIDRVLENVLGSRQALEPLLERKNETDREVVPHQPAQIERRLVELDTQRRRVKDAYVEGVFELQDLQKRIAVLDGERSALESVSARESQTVVVDPAVVAALVDVFGTWSQLSRDQKRAILKEFRIRVSVIRGERRGPLVVTDLKLGVVRDDFRIEVTR